MTHQFNSLTDTKISQTATVPIRQAGQWHKKDFQTDVLHGKKVIIFGLPGAFTPTCSSSHLPRYEQLYDTFKAQGIDEIWCLAINDTFVMNAWAKHQGVSKVKMLPDGNGSITRILGMTTQKTDLGFGDRAWRFSILINNGVVEQHFIENPNSKEADPFEVSDADTMLNAINPIALKPTDVMVFTKTDCTFCLELKKALKSSNTPHTEIVLPDSSRNATLRAILGPQANHTVPLAFINGSPFQGSQPIKKALNLL